MQFSILPTDIPEMQNAQIAVCYRPMTAVAGDFYEFVSADGKRMGFLVADVTGHGVPAALIASMIKVATQSVEACAHDPREVLRGLNRILSYKKECQEKNLPVGSMPLHFLSRHSAQLAVRGLLL